MKLVKKEWFKRDAVTVAKELLGKVITYDGCSGIIVETEAYQSDPASHGYRITSRSEIMLTTYGHLYVYFIYGMYYCLNITTNEGAVGAVLIRALEPLEGIPTMMKRRKTHDIKNLLSGPGKLCAAFNITKEQNGRAVNDGIRILEYVKLHPEDIATSPRIGITKGADLEWRFFIRHNSFVSKII